MNHRIGIYASAWMLVFFAPMLMAQQALTVNTQNLQEVVDFYFDVYLASENVAPNWNGSLTNCTPGTVNPALLDATALRINYFRAMAGMPANVTLDPALNQMCQQTALILSKNNVLSHTLASTLACYTSAGATGAARSNITLYEVGPGAVDLFIEDPGFVNTAVGHRRWLLYPPQLTMGVGAVPEKSTSNPASTAIYVMGQRSTASQPSSWPPAGYVPAQVCFYRWSYSYPGANFSEAKVFVTNEGVTKQYTPQPIANGYGDNTIVWSPTTAFPPQPMETYTVRLENVVVSGVSKTISYDVTRIDPYVVDGWVVDEPAPVPADYRVDFSLNADQVNPASASVATGCGTALVSPANKTLTLLVDHGVEAASNVMIGRGAAGVNGSVVAQNANAGDPFEMTVTLSDADLESLGAGGLYVLIQSSALPAGAIRGQIVNNSNADCVVVYEDLQAAVAPEPAGGMLLWDGETVFKPANGVASTVNPYSGTACFDGLPTKWNQPAVSLSGLNTYRTDISSYDEIWFYARADMAGRSLEFSVGGWPSKSNAVDITPYIQGGALDTTWRLVRLPMELLKTGTYTLDKIETLYFGLAKPQTGHHIFIDEVWAMNVNAPMGPGGDSEPAYTSALTIFDAELPFSYAYGAVSSDAHQGAAAFEGIPTKWNKPSVMLSGLPGYRADLSSYDEIWFYAKSDQTGKSLDFTVMGWPEKSNTIRIDNYIAGGALDTAWRLVRIPVSALKTATFSLDSVEVLSFGLALPAVGHHLFIDDVRAVKLAN
ncbi:MAG: CHRD domain-containing protein [Candidatus Hydrogenedentes bacterium]|nr:CHRD domain-containing protein [Candidatus Hydrogenedentota bacterium]